MPNSGHTWTVEEEQDLLALDREEFMSKYGLKISPDAYRQRKAKLESTMAISQLEPMFIEAAPKGEYVGFDMVYWDIETTSLDASMGRILCASFVDGYGRVKTFRKEDYPGKTLIDDSRLAIAIREELESHDIVVGWNSKAFDYNFVRGRLARAGERPPVIRKHIDAMFAVRGKLHMGASLDNVAKFFHTENQKPKPGKDVWELAAAGDREAMDLIVNRCEADCLVLRDIFRHIKPYITTISASM